VRADRAAAEAVDRTGRVVWITGASSGIGRATAHACARRGDRLVLSARSVEALDDVRRECERLGAGAVLVRPLDITDDAAVTAAAAAAVEAFGHLDVVVQNAGVAAYSRVEDTPPSTFDRVVEINVMGAFRVSRAAITHFRRQRAGSLVIVGSVLGRVAVPYMGAYNTSKWALRGLSRTLQAENADLAGVSITLVSPGGVDTPIYDQAANTIGRRPKPPFPVASPEAVASTVLKAIGSPRRELGVGWANPLIVAGSTFLPQVFDRIVTPVMHVGGLTRQKLPTTDEVREGNLHEPRTTLEQLRRDRSGGGPHRT
jgi:NAD(P)-dependent dehydrogenase (short-subunit alcohol dehydrogenase family)